MLSTRRLNHPTTGPLATELLNDAVGLVGCFLQWRGLLNDAVLQNLALKLANGWLLTSLKAVYPPEAGGSFFFSFFLGLIEGGWGILQKGGEVGSKRFNRHGSRS
jgi:hypothetical protein